MPFTVNDFEDLLKIIEAQPEWRGRLRRALFPEIDVPKALQALANAQAETNHAIKRLEATVERLAIGQEQLRQDVSVLKQDVSVLKQDVSVLKQDVGVLKQDSKELKTDVRALKGSSHERDYRDKADAIFGRYLRNGHRATNWVADQLHEALENDRISDADLHQVLAADLLWMGDERSTKQPLLLVLEASWLAESNDVERAQTRAAILRRIGIKALPVVGGREWTSAATELADAQGVVRTTNGSIDPISWQAAKSKIEA